MRPETRSRPSSRRARVQIPGSCTETGSYVQLCTEVMYRDRKLKTDVLLLCHHGQLLPHPWTRGLQRTRPDGGHSGISEPVQARHPPVVPAGLGEGGRTGSPRRGPGHLHHCPTGQPHTHFLSLKAHSHLRAFAPLSPPPGRLSHAHTLSARDGLLFSLPSFKCLTGGLLQAPCCPPASLL